MYPDELEINGITYKINTDYRYALACFEALDDEEINDIARASAIISLLLGKEDNNKVEIPDFNIQEMNEVLPLLINYLSCKSNEEETTVNTGKKDFDFIQDRKYINASFMSDYHIDLEETKMHWWKFCELIEGLTNDCILNRVRDLRNTDLSEYKDQKTRNKLIRAMENVKLKVKRTKEEKEAIEKFENLFK